MANFVWIVPPVDPGTVGDQDGVYRVRRRFARQRMASVSLEFSDRGAPGNSFVITEIALELGTKEGLTRLPNRTFT